MALLGACAPASIALGVTEVRKPLRLDNTRQVKTRQFALPKARSNSCAKMIKYSAIEIWSKIPPEIKNKTCLALFLAEYKKYVLLSYYNHILCFYLMLYIKQVD